MLQEVLPQVTVRITHSLCPNEASQHVLKGPNFALLGRVRGGRGVGLFGFLLFLMCSHQVPNGFSLCSPSAPCLFKHVFEFPMCFQQHLTLPNILCPKFYTFWCSEEVWGKFLRCFPWGNSLNFNLLCNFLRYFGFFMFEK